MNYNNFIFDLIDWVELNLDNRLTLNTVSLRSGYSKWHLQRVFTDLTGYSLGKYIRERKLTRAAYDLRMTNLSLIDISNKYCFDSQQSFNRSFKRLTCYPPAIYRHRKEWDFSSLHPSLLVRHLPDIYPKIVTLPRRFFFGKEHTYKCSLESIRGFDSNVRINLFKRYFSHFGIKTSNCYGFAEFTPARERDEIIIHYITASDIIPDTQGQNVYFRMDGGGEYIQFDYEGSPSGLQEFIVSLYQYYLPCLKVIKRKGVDIEYYKMCNLPGEECNYISCSYFIPCITTS